MESRKIALVLAAALAALAAACGDDDDGAADAGTDAATDTDTDAGADSDSDADSDADGGADTESDSAAVEPWMGCSDYNDCRWVCQDDPECDAACGELLSPAGAEKWDAVMACIDDNCDGLDGDAFNECFYEFCDEVWAVCWEDRGLDPDYVEVGPICNEVGQIAQNPFWFDAEGGVHEFAHDFYGQYPALLFVISAAWCGPCAAEAATLPGLQETYGAENLAILQLLTEGTTQGSEITEAIVQDWQDDNMGGAPLAGGKLTPTWINFIPDPSNFTIPWSIVIDGATMEIKAMGNDIDTAAIDALVP
jgi:thiol-disulfide isomerase/thioredoxin